MVDREQVREGTTASSYLGLTFSIDQETMVAGCLGILEKWAP
jgi:hypothetical protein